DDQGREAQRPPADRRERERRLGLVVAAAAGGQGRAYGLPAAAGVDGGRHDPQDLAAAGVACRLPARTRVLHRPRQVDAGAAAARRVAAAPSRGRSWGVFPIDPSSTTQYSRRHRPRASRESSKGASWPTSTSPTTTSATPPAASRSARTTCT